MRTNKHKETDKTETLATTATGSATETGNAATEMAGRGLNILVIRFRQMGDAVVATTLLDTLRQSFPAARIDFVLNDRIAPLFEGHPSISNVLAFAPEERRGWRYVRKVWQTVHNVRYDVIVDMRSTVNTLLFSLLSRRSPVSSGLLKSYSRPLLTHAVEPCGDGETMVDHNLKLLQPLERFGTLHYSRRPTLRINADEIADFRAYMAKMGIDFGRPVLLAGVTAKIAAKTWAPDRMEETLRQVVAEWPAVQVGVQLCPRRRGAAGAGDGRETGRRANVCQHRGTVDAQFGGHGGQRDGLFRQ